MKRVIIGISGASGALFGIRALEALAPLPDVECHLILSPGAIRTLVEETDWTADAVRALADVVHAHGDVGAPLASGSFRAHGMLIAPCSIKTLSGIAHCYDADLMVRAADVCLKERRPTVLLVRETPLHAGHIDLMARATASGAVIMPPVPAFYHRPRTIDDIVNQTVGRAFDLLGIDAGTVHRWKETQEP
ncbi:MAG: UbiX family flavin prenyltransferase [Rhodospirillum sp.]|nr:UbiX family flavin prenyltransferase [Rhodospirillum sp.]MCF8489402.1 UbiX family flavin prenyltransferase [Rhodospirillum sp.]MCF8503056.1 UbiX family flavin prenyltransferase [Rhodospirillum sp.]